LISLLLAASALLVTASSTALSAAITELPVIADDFQLAATFALRGFPGAESQAAFDENRSAFAEELGQLFATYSKENRIDKIDFIPPLLCVPVFDSSVDGDADVCHCHSRLRITYLWIASKIAHEEYFVDVSHLSGSGDSEERILSG
jgi:hypothetical protein